MPKFEMTSIDDEMVRPELVNLKPAERGRVLEKMALSGRRCEECGGASFSAGDALYLGFLFLDEAQDAFMIALTCRNPDCPQPHTGITLPEQDFLSIGGEQARAASWTVPVPDGQARTGR